MLRIRTRLSVFAGRSRTQVLASMVATFVGFAIFAVLPSASGGPDTRSAVELTSGGKFAARVPGAAEKQERPIDEGATPSETAVARHAALDFALLPPTEADTFAAAASGDATADKPSRSRRAVRPAPSRHPADAAPLPLARPTTLPPAEASTAPGDGFMPRLMASARSLWSFSASTGAAFVSRVVP